MAALYDLISANWRTLIRPEGVTTELETETYGKFTCQPLERGYGTTLGNALRRVLLQSFPGAAISSIRFDSGTLPTGSFSGTGPLLDDVTALILGLKEVIVCLSDGRPHAGRLERDVTGPVLAGHIAWPPGVHVLNPELSVLDLAPGSVLRADVGVAEGRGYLPAGRFEVDDPRLLGPDAIPIDAMFSPIRRVTFMVSQARVGEATDYDKLTLEIVTSGAVAPREALKQAGRLLVAHTAMWINFDELPEPEVDVAEQVAMNPALFQPVNELEFSVRALNCLQSARVELVGDLVQRTERELMGTRNFGRKSLTEIQAALGSFGLTLGMKIDQWEQMKVAWHARQKTGFEGDA